MYIKIKYIQNFERQNKNCANMKYIKLKLNFETYRAVRKLFDVEE